MYIPQNMSRFNMKFEKTPKDSSPFPSNTTFMNMNQQFKQTMDQFYMNYSDSPLSCERVIKDGSVRSTASNRFMNEFDSFAAMVESFQEKPEDESKSPRKIVQLATEEKTPDSQPLFYGSFSNHPMIQ